MTIAELFISIGIKGDGDAKKALGGVQGEMKGVISSSLAAKAAIVGVIYGLEQMVSVSNKVGTSLTMFSNLTGLSARQLQQWQYAGQQFGVTSDEITGSIKNVQKAMNDMLLGKGAPADFGIFARTMGFQMKDASNTFKLMGDLQKFMQMAPIAVGNTVGRSIGLSEGVMASMRRNAFNQAAFDHAPVYSDREAQTLTRVGAAWANLGQKIEMAIGHLNAKHGFQLVNDIGKITKELLILAEKLDEVAVKFKVFDTVANLFTGIANSLKLIIELSDKLSGKSSKPGDLLYSAPGSGPYPGYQGSPFQKFISQLGGIGNAFSASDVQKSITPNVDTSKVGNGPVMPGTSNVTVINHGVVHPKETEDATMRGYKKALRTSSAGLKVN